MKSHNTLHRLYMVAFGGFSKRAKALGVSIRLLVKQNDYSGKVLRRGTPGTFGFDLRPARSARTDRRGYSAPGNARNRRFARRHVQHFSRVSPVSSP